MKKFPFLLLDAGPIIKLFELGIWEVFIDRCDVTVSQTVADQAKWANQEAQDIRIHLEPYKHQGLITIIDIDASLAKSFLDRFDRLLHAEVHPGERETLAFLCDSTEDWYCALAMVLFFGCLACSAKAIKVFLWKSF